MKRCPVCGEEYSDSYKNCPFCEEEAALQRGEKIRRGAGNGKRPSGPSMISPILIALIVLTAVLVGYLLLGDQIKERVQGEEAKQETAEEVRPDETEEETSDSKLDYQKAVALPQGLTLDREDFTLQKVDQTCPLNVTGGSGTYQWFSEDPTIAEIDQDGVVRAIRQGTIQVVVTDGVKQDTCIVRVKVPETGTAESKPSHPSATSGPSEKKPASSGKPTLNREDMTLSVGQAFQLKLSDVTADLKWSSSNTNFVGVAKDGTVTGIAPGKATVTVSWNGTSRECTVYVKQ